MSARLVRYQRQKPRAKATQPLAGVGLGGILPVNWDYRHLEGGSDPEK
jgi:hypothetical protein